MSAKYMSMCRPQCVEKKSNLMYNRAVKSSWSPVANHRADSSLTPSQCETSLQSNAVSHWLGANLESALKSPPYISMCHRLLITDLWPTRLLITDVWPTRLLITDLWPTTKKHWALHPAAFPTVPSYWAKLLTALLQACIRHKHVFTSGLATM